MADPVRSSRRSSPTTPADYPTSPGSPTLSGLDHSFLLQMMTDLKGSVAALKESVDNLKDQSKEHDRKLEGVSKELRDKLETVGKDVHAGRVSIKVAAWVIGFFMTLLTLIWAIASKLITL